MLKAKRCAEDMKGDAGGFLKQKSMLSVCISFAFLAVFLTGTVCGTEQNLGSVSGKTSANIEEDSYHYFYLYVFNKGQDPLSIRFDYNTSPHSDISVSLWENDMINNKLVLGPQTSQAKPKTSPDKKWVAIDGGYIELSVLKVRVYIPSKPKSDKYAVQVIGVTEPSRICEDDGCAGQSVSQERIFTFNVNVGADDDATPEPSVLDYFIEIANQIIDDTYDRFIPPDEPDMESGGVPQDNLITISYNDTGDMYANESGTDDRKDENNITGMLLSTLSTYWLTILIIIIGIIGLYILIREW